VEDFAMAAHDFRTKIGFLAFRTTQHAGHVDISSPAFISFLNWQLEYYSGLSAHDIDEAYQRETVDWELDDIAGLAMLTEAYGDTSWLEKWTPSSTRYAS
jgi:hypothetical protein